ncbi:MAG: class A beta-lactamase-related serine hydrolase [Muribaculaceae bacterium]|nr:class A beta-lactamase-related serine hydrolase [Muribaculaceae bacterium]
MPKLARQYDEGLYSSRYTAPAGCRLNSDSYLNTRTSQYGQFRYIEQTQPIRRRKKHKAKKRNPLKALVSLSLLGIMLFGAMPYSFNKLSKSIFTPTPYKSIKTDLRDIAFPTNNYLANSWKLGERLFNYSANQKTAQMVPLKENVNMPVLRQELANLAEIYPTIQPSVYVWDYETGNFVDFNASKIYATASIIKIPVLIDVFKSIEAGQFSLNDKMPLTEYYRTEGSGSLQFKARNSEYTIDELARRMITESDNSATNMLMAKVGSMTDVNSSIRSWGLKNTMVNTWLPDLSGTNYTTARDMADMLYNIDENNNFLTEESRARIFDYMGHVHNNRLIQAGLGAGSTFLHKTGDIGKMLGDAGIVITPSGKKYIVVILANRPHNSIAGKDFIVHASEIIYNYMVK